MAIAALSAGALAVAGCGDDDDTTTASGTTGATGVSGGTLTKEQFITQADQICKTADADILEQAQALGNNPTADQITDFNENVVLPMQQQLVDSIRALGAPEGDEETVSALLDEVQSSLDAVKENPDLLADPDAAEQEFAEADQMAQDYGLKECGD